MLVIPVKQAETLKGGGDRAPKAEGTWLGTFENVEVRPLPRRNDNGELFAGYVGPDGERLSLTIGNNRPLDGQKDDGASKQFVDIVLSDGPYSLETTAYDDIPDTAWQLKSSARTLANLAAALNAIELVNDETAAVAGDFIDRLRAGAFNGTDIGYKIYHRTGKDKVVRAEIEMFLGGSTAKL